MLTRGRPEATGFGTGLFTAQELEDARINNQEILNTQSKVDGTEAKVQFTLRVMDAVGLALGRTVKLRPFVSCVQPTQSALLTRCF